MPDAVSLRIPRATTNASAPNRATPRRMIRNTLPDSDRRLLVFVIVLDEFLGGFFRGSIQHVLDFLRQFWRFRRFWRGGSNRERRRLGDGRHGRAGRRNRSNGWRWRL